MSMERIEAAITKLEALKAGAVSGPWTTPVARNTDDDWRCIVDSTDYCLADSTIANADLIVTLHRTIAAQLAILRNGVTWPSAHVTERGKSLYLELADAILGES